MGLKIYKVAAPGVGDNLLSGTPDSISHRWRAIAKIGFVGGAAVADSEIEIFFGNKKVGNLYNNDAGDAFNNDLIWPFGTDVRIPPKTPVIINLALDGGGQMNVAIDWVEY